MIAFTRYLRGIGQRAVHLNQNSFNCTNLHFGRFFNSSCCRRYCATQKLSTAADRYEVAAYATAHGYDLAQLRASLKQQGLYKLLPLPPDVTQAVYVQANYTTGEESREAFFFREGAAVFWNVPDVERKSVLDLLRAHEESPYDRATVSQEHELLSYSLTPLEARLDSEEGHIQVSSEPGTNQLQKYAFSNAMALSVKLGVWEQWLARFISSTESLSEDLQAGRRVRLSRGDVLRKSGQLFSLRHAINLGSDLLDTPDFYWDREELELLYQKTANYFSTAHRTRVMNEKLHHCCELADLLREHLNDKHHTRLEWMIIILILVEVLFEVKKFFD